MATANPYKPNGDPNNEIALDVITYSEEDGETLPSGGYYIKRHMRVPMKVDSETETKHVAIFPKTIATQVLETTTKAFVTKLQKDFLSNLSIVSGIGMDETKHLQFVDEDGTHRIPSTFEIGVIQSQVNTLSNDIGTLSGLVGNENNGLIKKVNTLESFFDKVDDADAKINKWHEIVEFLDGIPDNESLTLEGMIINTVSNLKSGDNIWKGTNSFTKSLSAANFVTSSYVQIIGSSNLSTKYEYGQISHINDGSGDNTILTIPTITGTIAIQEEIPYIGFIEPTIPKAGDIWFSV